jgi:hypothetical protein
MCRFVFSLNLSQSISPSSWHVINPSRS